MKAGVHIKAGTQMSQCDSLRPQTRNDSNVCPSGMQGKDRRSIKTGEYYLAIKNKYGMTHAAIGANFKTITLGWGGGSDGRVLAPGAGEPESDS